MKITLDLINKKKACKGGVKYFIDHWTKDGSPHHLEVLEQLEKDQRVITDRI